jgi:hypothetical protein
MLKKSSPSAPLASYYPLKRRTAIKPKDVTDTLRHAMRLNFHHTGIKAADISTRSLSAGGAMVMFLGKIDINVGRFAEVIYNNGDYTFQPDKTVPIIDTYID